MLPDGLQPAPWPQTLARQQLISLPKLPSQNTVTQEMLGSGLQHKDYDIAATLANSFHLVITGTGKADIIDAGIEFTVRHKGQPDL